MPGLHVFPPLNATQALSGSSIINAMLTGLARAAQLQHEKRFHVPRRDAKGLAQQKTSGETSL
jgi:hypothetical protein